MDQATVFFFTWFAVQEGMKLPMDHSAPCFNPYMSSLVKDNSTVIGAALPEWPPLKGCVPQKASLAQR